MTEVIAFKTTMDDQASKKFDKLRGSIKLGTNVVSKMAKAVVAGAGAVPAFNVVVNNAIIRQDNFAKRVGVSVTELTKLQFSATQAGLSTETFNMATQRLIRRSSEAAKGLGEAQGALRELGIDATNFNNLGLEDKMNVLAQELGGVSSESDRLRIAFKLFDSEGTAVLQMLGDNGEAMRAAANDAEFLGLAISKQAGAQAQLFGEKMGRATGALKGLSNTIVSETSPVIAGLADKFADMVARNRNDIATFIKNSIVGTVAVGIAFKQMFDRLTDAFTTFSGFKDFLNSIVDFGKDILDQAKGILTAVVNLFKNVGSTVKDFFKNLFKGGQEGIWDTLVESGKQALDDLLNDARTFGSEYADAVVGGAQQVGSGLLDTLGVDMDLATEKAKTLLSNISLFAATTGDATKENMNEITEFMTLFQENQGLFLEWLNENTKQFMESLRNSAQMTIESLSAGLAQAITTGGSLLEVFQNVAKQLVTSLIASFIKMGIQRLILSKLTGGLATKEAAQGASKAVGLAGANMFASMAAAPFPINLTAPAAAAAAMAGAAATFSAGAATGAGLGATIGGVAHGGMTHNPSEQTMTIRKGERIVSPRQNEDLTAALEGGGLGGMNIGNLEIIMFPNATNADAVLEMDSGEISTKMEDAILTALNNLDERGIRPNFVDRSA